MSMTRLRFSKVNGAMRLLAFLLAVGLLSTSAIAQSELKAKAQTITQGDFLNASDAAGAAEFDVAETAPTVRFVQIPLPDREANPWSIWGYSVIHSNGKVYIPLGDHRGIDANSYIYEYDPETGSVRQVADVLSAAEGYEKGDFGYGKIHGRLNEGTDGNIYFGTYWGQWNKGNEHFEGDRVFRYNPETEELTDLGMPEFGWGYPSTHMASEHDLFYAEAHFRKSNAKGDPENNYVADRYDASDGMINIEYDVQFLAYDVQSEEVVFLGGHDGLKYGRDFFVDDDGNAYFNNGDGNLAKYDPAQNEVVPVESVKMPAARIRRAVGPDENGVMYGSTHEPNSQLFAFDPDGEQKIRTIAKSPANTAAMDVTESGEYLYYIPGAHGGYGARALVQVDTSSGQQKVIAFLEDPVWQQSNFNLGGTYSVHVTDDGGTVYVAINGVKGDDSEHWGDLAFVEVQIPESER